MDQHAPGTTPPLHALPRGTLLPSSPQVGSQDSFSQDLTHSSGELVRAGRVRESTILKVITATEIKQNNKKCKFQDQKMSLDSLQSFDKPYDYH